MYYACNAKTQGAVFAFNDITERDAFLLKNISAHAISAIQAGRLIGEGYIIIF